MRGFVICATEESKSLLRIDHSPAGNPLIVKLPAPREQLQAFPDQATFCTTETPCTTRYVWEFHFVSLPFMALAAFVFIITMTLLVGLHGAATEPMQTAAP